MTRPSVATVPAVVLVTAAAMVALGVLTVHTADAHPDFALSRPGPIGSAVLLLPAWSLIAVGLVGWWRRQEAGPTAWLAVAGVGWLVAEWGNPGVGLSVAFTAGLVLAAVVPVLVLHAAVSYPAGRPDRLERVVLATGYVVTVVVQGLVPAMADDPAGAGCLDCPRDLIAVADRTGLAVDVTRTGPGLTAAWALVAVGLLVRRVTTGSPARRRARAGVAAGTAAYLVLVAAAALHTLLDDSQFVDEVARRLRTVEAVALVAVAAAVAWGWARRGRTRARVARLVLDLAALPPPGGLRDALAAGLGDPTLRLGYRLADGRLVAVDGQPVVVAGAATELVRGGRPVATLTHRPGLLDDPRVADEVAAASRLAIENERLQAELAAQLTHLRSSRQRIIATADATRRRLERDLHDGAQQQLVGLLLRLRLERSALAADDRVRQDMSAEVERQLESAVDELRELARGLFPAALADEGLAAAVEDFADEATVPVTVTGLPVQRLPEAVESAAYFVVAEAVRRSAATRAAVAVVPADGLLTVDVTLPGVSDGDGWLAALEDRVGALEGELAVVPSGDGLSVRAVIPCAS